MKPRPWWRWWIGWRHQRVEVFVHDRRALLRVFFDAAATTRRRERGERKDRPAAAAMLADHGQNRKEDDQISLVSSFHLGTLEVIGKLNQACHGIAALAKSADLVSERRTSRVLVNAATGLVTALAYGAEASRML
jgi:hypothetical protein